MLREQLFEKGKAFVSGNLHLKYKYSDDKAKNLLCFFNSNTRVVSISSDQRLISMLIFFHLHFRELYSYQLKSQRINKIFYCCYSFRNGLPKKTLPQTYYIISLICFPKSFRARANKMRVRTKTTSGSTSKG